MTKNETIIAHVSALMWKFKNTRYKPNEPGDRMTMGRWIHTLRDFPDDEDKLEKLFEPTYTTGWYKDMPEASDVLLAYMRLYHSNQLSLSEYEQPKPKQLTWDDIKRSARASKTAFPREMLACMFKHMGEPKEGILQRPMLAWNRDNFDAEMKEIYDRHGWDYCPNYGKPPNMSKNSG